MPQEILNAEQVLASSRMLDELAHALAAIEFLNRGDNCIALCLRLGEPNGVREVAIGNIYSRFHDSILGAHVFHVKGNGNTEYWGYSETLR